MDDYRREDEREKPVLNPLDWTKSASVEDSVPDMDRLSPGSTGDAISGGAGAEAATQRSRDREKNKGTPTAVSASFGLGGSGLPPHSNTEPRPASAMISPELVSALMAVFGKEMRKIVKEERKHIRQISRSVHFSIDNKVDSPSAARE